MVSLKKLAGYATGSVRARRRLYSGSSSSVREVISTLGGSGRRAKSWGMAGSSAGSVTGVDTREPLAGVTARDERGLFFERGLEGACRKSSGMSFQFSMGCGTVEVVEVVEGARGGAEEDFGGGGGRF